MSKAKKPRLFREIAIFMPRLIIKIRNKNELYHK